MGVSSQEIQRVYGIPATTIRNWQNTNKMPKDLDILAAGRAIIDILKQQAEELRTQSTAKDPLIRAKIALTQRQTEKLALELALQQGELVPSADVEKVWGNYCSAVKKRLLSLPNKLAYELAGIGSPITVENRLQEIITEVLGELSANDFGIGDIEENQATIETTPTIDDQ